MKKSKESIISYVLFSVSLVLLCVALVTGVVSGLDPLIEKICFFLGISLNCLGFIFLNKSKEKNDNNCK